MQQVPLGRTGLCVSGLCPGRMTRGTRTDAAGAHDQIDPAPEHGVTFCGIAGMYSANPVPAETLGRTEGVIGRWIAKGGPGDRAVPATRVAGAVRLCGPLPGKAGRGAETACARQGDGALWGHRCLTPKDLTRRCARFRTLS